MPVVAPHEYMAEVGRLRAGGQWERFMKVRDCHGDGWRGVLDRMWRRAARMHELVPGRPFRDQSGRWWVRQWRFAPFAWLAEVLIARGWLVGPENGLYRDFRLRRPDDPPHPWCTDWEADHYARISGRLFGR